MISDYYDQDFTVEYEASSCKSALGSWKPVFATLGTFKGFMDLVSGGGRANQVGAQWLDLATHVVGCSSTNSWVKTYHRMKDSDSNTYRILHIDNPIKRNHHLEIFLEYNSVDMLTT